MAVLILSWAKWFQRESAALPDCRRGWLSTIFPFVSSRSNSTIYFHFYLPMSSRSGSKIHLCSLSLLCLCSFSLLPYFFFYLPSTSSPLDRVFWWLWFSFLFLDPLFNKAFACPTAVLHMYVTFPRPCCLQLESLWQSKTWALCKQRYRMSSPQLHRYA